VKLVLASRSPQRRAILTQLGVEFAIRPVDAEELTEGPPAELALENAYRKASAAERGADETVLGVDTIVALGRRVYGKPADAAEARATLEALAGRTHEVLSGLCAIGPDGRPRTAGARTEVTFRTFDAPLLDWYLAAGEWRERAGGYAIQGRGAALVTSIEGDYFNVVGLPVAALLDLLPQVLGESGKHSIST
jgi:septum formation protein